MLPDATSSLPLYSFSSLSFQPAVLLLTLLSTATFASLRSLSLLLLPPPYPPPKKSRGNQEYKKRWKATGDSLITTGHFSLSRGAHLSPPSQPPRADEKQPQILSVAPLPPFFFFLSCPLLFLAALDHGSCFRLHRKTPLLRPFYACCLIRSRTTKTTSAAENLRTERERVKPSPAGWAGDVRASEDAANQPEPRCQSPRPVAARRGKKKKQMERGSRLPRGGAQSRNRFKRSDRGQTHRPSATPWRLFAYSRTHTPCLIRTRKRWDHLAARANPVKHRGEHYAGQRTRYTPVRLATARAVLSTAQSEHEPSADGHCNYESGL